VKYLALITGYQFLLILTGIASGLAFVTSRKRMTAQQVTRSRGRQEERASLNHDPVGFSPLGGRKPYRITKFWLWLPGQSLVLVATTSTFRRGKRTRRYDPRPVLPAVIRWAG